MYARLHIKQTNENKKQKQTNKKQKQNAICEEESYQMNLI